MTEEQAKRRWCPFVQIVVRGDPSDDELWSNRPDNGFSSDSYCIGNECMAWRWTKDQGGDFETGFCGLAGKPQEI